MLPGSGFREEVNLMHEAFGIVRIPQIEKIGDIVDLLSILRSVLTHTYTRGV